MPRTMMLFGPQGTGKTLIAKRLAKYFQLTQVIEEFDDREPYPAEGALLVTDCPASRFDGRRIHIHTAKRLLGIRGLAELTDRQGDHRARGIAAITHQQYVARLAAPRLPFSQR